jgi:hypothetical protein
VPLTGQRLTKLVEALLLTAIAAFAEAFVNPVAPILMLVSALTIRRQAAVRVVAVLVGILTGLPGHLDEAPLHILLSMLGAAAAWLLHAEIALHLIAPLLRWAARCVQAGWEIALLALAVARRYLRKAPSTPGPPPPGEDLP